MNGLNTLMLKEKLQLFFIEDIGEGDRTTAAIFSPQDIQTGTLTVKEAGVMAGLSIIALGYQLLDPSVKVELHCKDGDFVEKGMHIASVSGPVTVLLTGERVILNLLQRMSGIASFTYQAVTELGESHTRICDTRKTTPGLRIFEKYAVQ